MLKSHDLVHWKIIGHVLPRLTFAPEYDLPGPFSIDDATSKPVTGTKYASGVWAPAIRYHSGLFYVYWPTPDEGIFMATAKDPRRAVVGAGSGDRRTGLRRPLPVLGRQRRGPGWSTA